eukprot:COSAG02_NODE_6762_length_3380_cov_2.135795_2_plen_131_part_00
MVLLDESIQLCGTEVHRVISVRQHRDRCRVLSCFCFAICWCARPPGSRKHRNIVRSVSKRSYSSRLVPIPEALAYPPQCSILSCEFIAQYRYRRTVHAVHTHWRGLVRGCEQISLRVVLARASHRGRYLT